jgi:energy-converting hydrogenase Eha subunit G
VDEFESSDQFQECLSRNPSMVASKSLGAIVAFCAFETGFTGIADLGFSIFFAIVSNRIMSDENVYKYPTFSFIRLPALFDSLYFD